MIPADSIYDSDGSLSGYDACTFADSVFAALSDDQIIVVGVVADLDDVCGDVPEVSCHIVCGKFKR